MTNSNKTAAVSRRGVLRAAGAAGAVVAAGALGGRVFSPAIAGPAPKIRLAWGDVAACHSPLGFGVAKGLYAKHNLDVDLYPSALERPDAPSRRSPPTRPTPARA